MKTTKPTDTAESGHSIHENRDRLISEHIGLAYKFAGGCQNRGLPLEDLRQEALLGLLEAASRFDPERGLKFGTYAGHWIKKALLAALERENCATRATEPLGERDPAAPDTREEQQCAAPISFPDCLPALERAVLALSINQSLSERGGPATEHFRGTSQTAARQSITTHPPLIFPLLKTGNSTLDKSSFITWKTQISLHGSRDQYGINTGSIRMKSVLIPYLSRIDHRSAGG